MIDIKNASISRICENAHQNTTKTDSYCKKEEPLSTIRYDTLYFNSLVPATAIMNENSMTILFVLQFIGQPRFSKRMSMLSAEGFQVEAIAFERSTHRGRLPTAPVKTLGNISHGQFLKRVPTLLKSLPVLRKEIRNHDVVYCMGPDMSLLVTLASIGLKTIKIVEVGDINPIQTRKGVIGKVARIADRWQINTSALLVVTAPDFLRIYYREWLNSTIPGLVIENKVEQSALTKARNNQTSYQSTDNSNTPITIGYFGLLRCKWSWSVLIQLMKDNPDTHRLVLAGVALNIENFEEIVNTNSNIVYKGKYKSPEDLPELYDSVDIVWACYPPNLQTNWNHNWARPNRFYEACLYRKPLITRDGSNDSVVIKERNIGFSLDISDCQEAAVTVSKIGKDQISNWQTNMTLLPEDLYTYTTEAEELAQFITDID